MNVNVEITNVNPNANMITFNNNGVSETKEVVAPAQVKWAKIGPAELGLNAEGKVNFVRSTAPKQQSAAPNYNRSMSKYESEWNARGHPEIFRSVTLEEFQQQYDLLEARDKTKVNASNLFRLEDGRYDAVIFTTVFTKKE